jgi:hypothetical protein
MNRTCNNVEVTALRAAKMHTILSVAFQKEQGEYHLIIISCFVFLKRKKSGLHTCQGLREGGHIAIRQQVEHALDVPDVHNVMHTAAMMHAILNLWQPKCI